MILLFLLLYLFLQSKENTALTFRIYFIRTPTNSLRNKNIRIGKKEKKKILYLFSSNTKKTLSLLSPFLFFTTLIKFFQKIKLTPSLFLQSHTHKTATIPRLSNLFFFITIIIDPSQVPNKFLRKRWQCTYAMFIPPVIHNKDNTALAFYPLSYHNPYNPPLSPKK